MLGLVTLHLSTFELFFLFLLLPIYCIITQYNYNYNLNYIPIILKYYFSLTVVYYTQAVQRPNLAPVHRYK